jgi:hypothetical protein
MSRSYSKWYQLKQHAYVYIVVISNIVAEISKVIDHDLEGFNGYVDSTIVHTRARC